jgi:NAD+ synthase (glutamine-hydrolysing)
MKPIKVGAVVLNQIPLDWQGNKARIEAAIAAARERHVSVLCLPELCITGYGCEDAFLSQNTVQRAWKILQEILPATKGMIVSVGLPMLHQHGLLNCACLIVDGRIAGFTAKRFLAGDGIHYEPRWFKPWPHQVRHDIEIDGEKYPIGDLCFDCGGALIASAGRLIARGPRFSFRDFDLTTASIDVDAIRLNQARVASFQPQLNSKDDCIVQVPFHFSTAELEEPTDPPTAWETGEFLKEEEFTRAEALALFDYLRKSKSHGFVVSLSGGADSAAVACLVHTMAALALKELGPEALRAKLGRIPHLSVSDDAKALIHQLLTTAYQASENSGSVTRQAARAVATEIGAEHYEWEINDIVSRYVDVVEKATGTKLDWAHHDISLQNIQARVRSPGIWMIANLKNALLLATSNRSEGAVGYATMDGDTSGGLSPLAGIDKAWLWRWLRWMETTGPGGLTPIPALAAVNCQVSTAELRPAGSNQTDEADLMPYDVLDAIERAAIRDKHGPIEVFSLMRPKFPAHSPGQLALWIERFFRLWSRNQWKRERYAPSFHLDDENLDPKTWCQFPILSGGFETELAELRSVADKLGRPK